MTHYSTYLALGDSYTIGESVPLYESFPYLVNQLMRKAKHHFQAPEIVAKTGWTSNELAEHILHAVLNDQYDFVTLLVGVNNQYRDLAIKDFENDFAFLANKAIHLAGNKSNRVMVLSIPDWGYTPFANGKEIQKINKEIDDYNEVCAGIAKRMKTHFINITDETRAEKNNLQALASDHLHYSKTTHLRWAEKIASIMKQELKK